MMEWCDTPTEWLGTFIFGGVVGMLVLVLMVQFVVPAFRAVAELTSVPDDVSQVELCESCLRNRPSWIVSELDGGSGWALSLCDECIPEVRRDVAQEVLKFTKIRGG